MKVNGLTKVNVIGCYTCAIEAVKPRGSMAEKGLSTSSSFFFPHNSAPSFNQISPSEIENRLQLTTST